MESWHLLGHLIIALVISGIIFKRTKNKNYVLLCILASFLIDVDHLFDFWMAYGFSLDLKTFFKTDFFEINGKVFVPFHSWELIAIIFLLSTIIKKYKWPMLAIGLAMLTHVLWDAFSYKIAIADYSLMYRAAHNFQVECKN